MTVQNDSFRGALRADSNQQHGRSSDAGLADLPSTCRRRATLQNSWNANFVLQGQHVVVTPLADQGNLDIGATVMLGYCASQTGTNLVATPGSCDSTQGTAITQNANAERKPGGRRRCRDQNGRLARGLAGAGRQHRRRPLPFHHA